MSRDDGRRSAFDVDESQRHGSESSGPAETTLISVVTDEEMAGMLRSSALRRGWPYREIVAGDAEGVTRSLDGPLLIVIEWDERSRSTKEILRMIRTSSGPAVAILVAVSDLADAVVTDAVNAGADDVVQLGSCAETLDLRLSVLDAAARRGAAARESESGGLEGLDGPCRELFEHLPCGVFEVSREGRLIQWNDALQQLLGYGSIEELLLLNLPHDVFLYPAHRYSLINELQRNGVVADRNILVKTTVGTAVLTLDYCFGRKNESGEVVSYLGVVTERGADQGDLNLAALCDRSGALQVERFVGHLREANEKLRRKNRELEAIRHELERSEFSFRYLVENLNDGVFRCDESGAVVYVSPSFERIFGVKEKDLIGTNWTSWVHPDDLPERLRNMERIALGESVVSTFRLVIDNGDVREVRCSTSGSFIGERMVGYQGIVSDLSVMQEAERMLDKAHSELERRNRFLEVLLDTMPNAVYFKDLEGRYIGCNRAFEEVAGMSSESLIGKTALETWDLDQGANFHGLHRELLATGGTRVDETTVLAPGKAPVSVVFSRSLFHDDMGRVAGTLGVLTDVTELRHLEGRLRHAEKMEALGQFAGAMAHDFNNLIMIIRGTAQLMARQLRDDDPFRGELGLILQTTKTAADLSRGLLAFARRQVLDRTNLEVGKVLSGLQTMLSRLLHPGIHLEFLIGGNLHSILADRSSLERAVVNLVLNARDAVEENGKIEIRVEEVVVDEQFMQSHPWATPGHFIAIRVVDDGVGMAPEVVDRVFDPFFTTKPHEHGTGLGLATVYGTAKQHDGFVIIDSELGQGTTVSILLPLSEAVSEPSATSTAPREPVGATGRVLIVEDSSDLRTVIARYLQSLGYTTFQAENGRVAMEVLEREGDDVLAVISDLVMPELSGVELLNKARERWPHLGFVLCSGNRGEFEDTAPVLDDRVVRLEKPFDIEDIAARLDAVIARGRSRQLRRADGAGEDGEAQ